MSAPPVVRVNSIAGALVIVALMGQFARAEPGPDGPVAAREGGAGKVTRRVRLLPVGAAIVPGLLLHGAGHYVAGERDVARRLFVVEGVGLGMAAVGGTQLLVTGASRHFSGPPIALIVSGVGLFGMSWLADLYGVAGGGHSAEAGGAAPLEVEAGYGYVYDPRFAYRQFAVAEASAWLGSTRVAPSVWVALDDDNQRMRLEGTRRLVGAGSARPTGDVSRVELTGAVTHHRYPGHGFAVTTGEVMLGGRLDMGRVGDSLAGSFTELGLGLGAEVTNYYTPGAGANLGELLLARFACGVLIGRPDRVHGEASIYYDHRRDTFTGGISPGTGPGSGFAGFFGADLHLYMGARWGVRALFEQGAARVANLGLLMRFGGSSP